MQYKFYAASGAKIIPVGNQAQNTKASDFLEQYRKADTPKETLELLNEDQKAIFRLHESETNAIVDMYTETLTEMIASRKLIDTAKVHPEHIESVRKIYSQLSARSNHHPDQQTSMINVEGVNMADDSIGGRVKVFNHIHEQFCKGYLKKGYPPSKILGILNNILTGENPVDSSHNHRTPPYSRRCNSHTQHQDRTGRAKKPDTSRHHGYAQTPGQLEHEPHSPWSSSDRDYRKRYNAHCSIREPSPPQRDYLNDY